MSTLTLRIPDAKYERLKKYAKAREVSLNKLFDEWATIALAQFDAKVRFETMAAKGDKARGIELLEKLEKIHRANQ
jgi:hypothetical protein